VTSSLEEMRCIYGEGDQTTDLEVKPQMLFHIFHRINC